MPSPLRRLAGRAATGLSDRVGRGFDYTAIVDAAGKDELPFWGGAICYRGSMKDRVLANGRGAGLDSYDIVRGIWEGGRNGAGDADLLQRMTHLELKLRLAELLLMRVDKMTMANSVEARVPFLDHEFVEFAMALPPEMKVRRGVGKYALKKAVEAILPNEIVHRRKQGFGAPVSEWFQGALGERVQREIRSSALADRGLLNYDYLDELWARHRGGRGDFAFHLWNVYNVSAWYDYWVAGRALAGA
jgi:asparagine synthase (glutamine-hydrolysing)